MLSIRNVRAADAGPISAIYNQYIMYSTATFEEETVSTTDMVGRIRELVPKYPWIVCEVDGVIAGYTYARRWRERASYRNTVETGTYLDPVYVGKGIGSALKAALIEALREKGFHTVISGIALPNPASVALVEKFGFKKVAHFTEVGFKMNKWIDVGYWQLML